MTRTEKTAQALGLVLGAGVTATLYETFQAALVGACQRDANGWWPVKIISLLAAAPIVYLVVDLWRRLVVARWMKPHAKP
jgi:hypothetical protein